MIGYVECGEAVISGYLKELLYNLWLSLLISPIITVLQMNLKFTVISILM